MNGDTPEQQWNRLQREYQKAVQASYPNPGRHDCPGTDALRDLAVRSARSEDLEEDCQWKHVLHCGPCYDEYLDLRASCRLGDAARANQESR
jgi:hypothetical protein